MTNLNELGFLIKNSHEMIVFGKSLGKIVKNSSFESLVVYLSGELGSGKTTLVRGFLRALGFKGKVKSPTFTILEPYQVDDLNVYHLDLYRIYNKAELEHLGIRDYCASKAIFLIEWPENARAILPEPDLIIDIRFCTKFINRRYLFLKTVSKNIEIFVPLKNYFKSD